MARFRQVFEPEGSSSLANLYRDIVGGGFGDAHPINWFTAQASRPDILAATWELVDGILVKGRLPGTVKQMIALAISAQNECRYCTVTHTHALEAMGIPTETITDCTSVEGLEGLPEPHRSMVGFAVRVARDPNGIEDGDFERLRSLGIQDEEILELCMMAAFSNFINTWAEVSGLEVDGEAD